MCLVKMFLSAIYFFDSANIIKNNRLLYNFATRFNIIFVLITIIWIKIFDVGLVVRGRMFIWVNKNSVDVMSTLL